MSITACEHAWLGNPPVYNAFRRQALSPQRCVKCHARRCVQIRGEDAVRLYREWRRSAKSHPPKR